MALIKLLFAFVQNNPEALIALLGMLVTAVVVLGFKHFSRSQQDEILKVTKGAYQVVAAISKTTPIPWDDAVAEIILRAENEMQRQLKPQEVAKVRAIATSLLADPKYPDVEGVNKSAALALPKAPPKP